MGMYPSIFELLPMFGNITWVGLIAKTKWLLMRNPLIMHGILIRYYSMISALYLQPLYTFILTEYDIMPISNTPAGPGSNSVYMSWLTWDTINPSFTFSHACPQSELMTFHPVSLKVTYDRWWDTIFLFFSDKPQEAVSNGLGRCH